MNDISKIMSDWVGSLDIQGFITESMTERQSLNFRNALAKKVYKFRYMTQDGKVKKVRGTLMGKYLPGGKYEPKDDFEDGYFTYWDLKDKKFETFEWDGFMGTGW